MKYLILFSLAVIVIPLYSQRKEELKLYGITIKANEILGQGRTFGPEPRSGERKTEIIDPAPVAHNVAQFLGAIYSAENFSGLPEEFLNSNFDIDIPILDSINVTWYNNKGFQLSKSKFKDSNKFDSIRAVFRDRKVSISVKKELLVSNYDIWEELERHKYDTTRAISFQITNDIEKAFKIGFGISLNVQLQKLLKTANADVKLKIDRIVNENLKLSNAFYYEVELTKSYIQTAAPILKYWLKNKQKLSNNGDLYFSPVLEDFYNSCDEAVIARAAVFQVTVDKAKLKKIETDLNALAKVAFDGKVHAAAIDSATAEIGGQFYKNKNKGIELREADAFYYVRFVRNPLLELGECGEVQAKD